MKTRLQINAKLDPVLYSKLEAYCKNEKVDKSAILRISLRSFLDNSSDVGEIRKEIKKLSAVMGQLTMPTGGEFDNVSIPVISTVLYDIAQRVEGLHNEMQNQKGGE